MTRVALLCPDLLFGSKVEGGLRAAGHEVTRVDRPDEARAALPEADLLVVDLTDDADARAALVAELKQTGSAPLALGFYSHVDQDVRRRAEAAGFDQVVPRSRMARDMAALVDALVDRGGVPPRR